MTLTATLPDQDGAPIALHPAPRFVALCIEHPSVAATSVAISVTTAALAISLCAALLGSSAGAGLAVFYVTSCWALAVCVRIRGNGTGQDGR